MHDDKLLLHGLAATMIGLRAPSSSLSWHELRGGSVKGLLGVLHALMSFDFSSSVSPTLSISTVKRKMPDPFAIITDIQTCCGLLKGLYDLVQKYRSANRDVADLALRFSDDETLLQRFMEFFKEHAEEIAEEDRSYMILLTARLVEILTETRRKVDRYSRGGVLDKLSWLILDGPLIAAEQALSDWVKRLNIRFTLLPQELQQEMTRKATSASYRKALSGLIASVHMRHAKEETPSDKILKELCKPEGYAERGGGQIYRKDFVATSGFDSAPVAATANEETVEHQVARLIHVLRKAEPSQSHIPKAEYYFKQESSGVYGIVYAWPQNVARNQGQFTLKELVKQSAAHPLNDRIRVAQEVVSAVAYVHAIGWVHKAVQSSNIVLTRYHSDTPSALGHVNLVGFTYARPQEKRSSGTGHSDWQTEIYRHPRRQRPTRSKAGHFDPDEEESDTMTADEEKKRGMEYFKEKHDVYSVGVVLFELGLWKDLDTFAAELKVATPDERKQALLGLSRRDLAKVVGQRYDGLVRRCLQVDDTEISAVEVLRELEDLKW